MPANDDDGEDDKPRRARRRDDAEDDGEEEDYRPKRRRQRDNDDDFERSSAVESLIPFKNGMALASYYCGVFSFIPCLWGTLSIVAIVLGFLGLNKAKSHPEAKGKGHAIAGIVLGTITVLLGVAATVYIVISANAR